MNWRLLIIKILLFITNSHVFTYVRSIETAITGSAADKGNLQEKALHDLLVHAYKNIPYYSSLFDQHGIAVDGTIDLKKFHQLPILTKDIIRAQEGNLYSSDKKERKYYENSSGGTTGEPVKFIQDKLYDDWNIATKIWFNKRLGKLPGKPEIKLWGSDRDIILGNLTVKDRIINRIYNRVFYNSYDFSEEKILNLITLHNTFKPNTYWAYVDSMTALAEYISTHNITVHSPTHIITSIGPLFDKARSEITEAFQCPVYNQYGSREIGVAAIDTPSLDYMDTFFWRLLIEIVPKEGTEEGEILITTLNNYSMPLIRYSIGDVAVPSKAAGSTVEIGGVTSHLKISRVVGRTLGFFKKEDGSLIHSHHMVQQMFFRPWIKQFQFVQDEYSAIRCRIVLKNGQSAAEDELEDITQKIQVLTGDSMNIIFEFPTEIQKQSNGKFVYTVCNID